MKIYSSTDIQTRLRHLDGWTFDGHFLIKTLRFKDFNETFAFMSRIALLAESLGHHPEWSGGYNHLCIRLQTHDYKGITDLDFQFAEQVQSYL